MCNGSVLIWWIKSENSRSVSNQIVSCYPVTDVLFVKRLESQGKNMLKTLVKCVTKTSEDSVKKQSQENKTNTSFSRCKILTWLLEKHITMPPVREIILERMTDTRKPSKTLKSLKSKLPARPYIFSTSFSMLWAESFRDKEITTLRKHDETGTFHASSL